MVGRWRWNERARLDNESKKVQDQILNMEGMETNPMKRTGGNIDGDLG
jgi:hypothetical protein